MKSYSIGREENNSIVIFDISNKVSRNHATLVVDGSKMTITDHSSNGTYINGIKISSNIPVPVTRRDVVTFADEVELDWKSVPNPTKRLSIIFSVALAVIAVIAVSIIVIKNKKDADADEQRERERIEREAAVKQAAEEKEQLTSLLSQLKLNLDSLSVNYSKAMSLMKEVNSASSKKVGGKDLLNITKEIGVVENDLSSIDISELQRSLVRVEENFKDEVKEAPSRIDQVKLEIEAAYAKVNVAISSLEKIQSRLNSIPNVKKTSPTKKVEIQIEEPKDTIVKPTILM